MEWKKKQVAIAGVGIEGIAVARFLVKNGAHVTLLDQKTEQEIDPQVRERIRELGLQTVFGKEYLANLERYDIIVRSPGVRRLLPELLAAEKKGVTITSQTQIFFDLCPSPIIGVTGTKGKGTTATLIYQMLKASGVDAYLGGNIGMPPIAFLDKLTKDSQVVLELSSFQLQDITKSPHIAVMLMVTSEHLDYHQDTQEYVAAKRNILSHQTAEDAAVINRDYPASNESDIYTEGKVFFVSRERETENGCFVRGGKIFVKRDGHEEEIIATEAILLPGGHNLENVCAAVMAAKIAGVAKKYIVDVLKTFPGLEHRLELVREVEGVKYYNDSFSTTPETAIAAIEAFTQPEVLILGGSSKGSDFSELGSVISKADNIKAIIGIGEEWDEIKAAISPSSEGQKTQVFFVEGAQDMRTIVQAAAKIAQSGDVVLLSPACASFGMFKNYKDRGEQFKREVESL